MPFWEGMYVKTVLALGQPDSAMCASTKQDIAYHVLIDFCVLVEAVYFMMIGHDFMLDLGLDIVQDSFNFCPVLLQVGLAYFSVLSGQWRKAIDCFQQINPEELIVNGWLSVLVAF